MVKICKFRTKEGVSSLASPIASDKLLKKSLKLVKKGCKKKSVKRGVKEVQKALRKNNKGICLIAGDISPIDVVSHLPGLCEDKGIPYVFISSKATLGEACSSKRATSCALIAKNDDYEELYLDVQKKISKVFEASV